MLSIRALIHINNMLSINVMLSMSYKPLIKDKLSINVVKSLIDMVSTENDIKSFIDKLSISDVC